VAIILCLQKLKVTFDYVRLDKTGKWNKESRSRSFNYRSRRQQEPIAAGCLQLLNKPGCMSVLVESWKARLMGMVKLCHRITEW